MPVLEAGLAGVLVVCTAVPAAVEIAGEDVTIFNPDRDPDLTARQILEVLERNPVQRLRRRTRQGYTWQAIFKRDIQPLLETVSHQDISANG
jgi:glycosyltransferase involved in cell wall biosynthesis